MGLSKIIRTSIVALLAMAAVMCFFAESDSMLVLFGTKGLGLLLGYASSMLFNKWDQSIYKIEE